MPSKFISDSLKDRINNKTHYLSDLGDIPVTKIRLNDWNPNEMTENEFKEFVSEIKHNGNPPKPIVLRKIDDEFYQIIDGEHCFKALREALDVDTLPPQWYVIEEYDDIEAKRQTYKRNLGGSHNFVKLGLMFESVLKETGHSNNKLAKEWCISEGSIRNALEYVKAYRLRNSYEVSKLSIRQIREYNRLPDGRRDEWLDSGADLSQVDVYRNKIIKITESKKQTKNPGYFKFDNFPNLKITPKKRTLNFSIDMRTGNLIETLKYLTSLAEKGLLQNYLEEGSGGKNVSE